MVGTRRSWLLFVASLAASDGGPPNAVLRTAMALTDRGHQVRVASLKTPGEVDHPLVDVAREHGVDIVQVPCRRRGRARFSFRMIAVLPRLVREADRVSVHGWYLLCNVQVVLAARLSHTPFSVQPHGVFEPYQEQVNRRAKRAFSAVFGRATLRATTMYLVASPSEAVGVRASTHTSAPVHVVGLGVDMPADGTHPDPQTSEPVVLYLGRIAAKKRIDLLLTAVAELVPRHPRLRLVVAGAGDPVLTMSLQREAERQGLHDRVEWVGLVLGRDKAAAFRNSTVFCLPSDNENFGQSLTEAMAAGLPVVTTTAVASSALLAQSGGGVAVAPGDTTALVGALDSYLTDPARAAAAGRANRQFCADNLSWSQVSDRWVTAWDAASPAELA